MANVKGTARSWSASFGLMACAVLVASPVQAQVKPRRADGELHRLAKVDPKLRPQPQLEARGRAHMNPRAQAAWDAFEARHGGRWQANVDRRTGHLNVAEGSGVAWVPGRGNRLDTPDIGAYLHGREKPDTDALEAIARDFVPGVEDLLGTQGRTLMRNASSGPLSDTLWNVDFEVYTRDGLKIDTAHVFFRVSHGNLVQWGSENLPPVDVEAPAARLSKDEALARLADYVGGLQPGRDLVFDRGTELAVPVENGAAVALARVWQFGFVRQGGHETWMGRVDAVTGEVLEFLDTNKYAQITGGAWPNSWKVDGVQQPMTTYGWPYAKLSTSGSTTNSSGIYMWNGTEQTVTLTSGNPYVNVNDTCGTSSKTTVNGSADWGAVAAGGPRDCTIVGGSGGAGNTASAHQQYYQVNKIMEKGRSYLPSNTWLQGTIPVNVNINNTCNAFWNGTSLNFYRSGGGCGNTGEDTGISLHEWGHGMDSNDGNGSSLDNGTGETYGDFSAALQTHDSCVGQGFIIGGNCGGYGNACTICDGVRDIDWGRHSTKQPWTVANFTQNSCPTDASYVGPCGNREGHCESYVSSGALFDFAKYDLTSGCSNRPGLASNPYPDYGCAADGTGAGGPYSEAAAWQVVDRLWYLSRGTANKAFTCTTGTTYTSNGCNAGSNWKTMRFVDDDDGNLANGTPHSCQLAAAFGRAGIACTTDASWNVCARGCTPPATPTLDTLTPGNNSITVSWTSATGVVDVYRNEVGCSAGFTKVANDLAGSSWVDTTVANGATYYYQVVAHDSTTGESCASSPSPCASATPTATANAVYMTGTASLTSVTVNPDGDRFVDNCEDGTVTFSVYNDGNQPLTNVTVTITTSNPAVTITSAPATIASLSVNGSTSRTFGFHLDGMADAGSATFDISVTATEMGGRSTTDSFTIGTFEQDFVSTTAVTHTFETGNDGWTLTNFTRDTTTGAGGTSVSLHSTSGIDGSCDKAVSPLFKIGTGSSVAMSVRYDIEPRSGGVWWDRANVHAVNTSTGVHTLLTPTGRTYNASGGTEPLCHATSQNGWADTNLTFGVATFSLAGLTAGQEYYLEVNYNTDGAAAGTGFWFDEVAWSNVELLGADAQSDACAPTCTTPGVPGGVTATAAGSNAISVSWTTNGADSYEVLRSTVSGGPYTSIGSVAAPPLVDTTVSGGTTYYYVVRATNDPSCTSASSTEASATATGSCTLAPTFGGVTGVTTLPSGQGCGLRAAWSAATSSCGGNVVYNVYRSTTSGFTPGAANLAASCVAGTSYDDTSVTAGQAYYYVVRAEDSGNSGTGACHLGTQDTNTAQASGTVATSTQTATQASALSATSNAVTSNLSPATTVAAASTATLNYTLNYTGVTSSQTLTTANFTALGGASGPTVRNLSPAATITQSATTVTFNYTAADVTKVSGAQLRHTGSNSTVAIGEGTDNTAYSQNVTTFYNTTGNGPGTYEFSIQGSGGGVAITNVSLVISKTTGSATANSRVELIAPNATVVLVKDYGAADPTKPVNVLTPYNTNGPGTWQLRVSENAGGAAVVTSGSLAVTGTTCSVAPLPVPFLTATGKDSQVTANWKNPATYAGPTRVCSSTSAFAADPACATFVDATGSASSVGSATFSGLANGTSDYVTAFVSNGAGTYSTRTTTTGYPISTAANAKWNFSTGAAALAPPYQWSGVGIFAASNDRGVHSMSPGATGGTWPSGWSPASMNGPAQSQAMVLPASYMPFGHDALFVSSQDGYLYCFNAGTGAGCSGWSSGGRSTTNMGLLQATPILYDAPVAADRVLLVGTRNSAAANGVYAIKTADGTTAAGWPFTNSVAQGSLDGGKAIGIVSGAGNNNPTARRFYFASRAKTGGSAYTVWAIDYSSGSPVLSWARGPAVGLEAAIGDVDGAVTRNHTTGALLVGTNNGEVVSLDPTTGATLWRRSFGDGPVKGFVSYSSADLRIRFSTTSKVWAIPADGSTGNDWSVSAFSPTRPLLHFGTTRTYVGACKDATCADGRLIELDGANGWATPKFYDVTGAGGLGEVIIDRGQTPALGHMGSRSGRVFAVQVPLP